MKQMRTRCLPSMTNHEVEEYLKRSDIIIIPVGCGRNARCLSA